MGPYLSTPNREKATETGASKNGRFRFVACGMQGWRKSMEDAHIAGVDLYDNKDVAVFGVFDGHGGKEVAAFVEKHFIEELKKNPEFPDGNIKKALTDTFLKMDELLQTPEGRRELSILRDEDGDAYGSTESFAGCTANVAVIYNNTLYVANAGDSRSVLCSKGNAVEMSNDHKPELDNERDRIVKAGGFINEGRINGNLNLSRAIGDLEYKRNAALKVDEQLIIAVPEIQTRALTDEDEFIVMGCDGIWETMSNQKIVSFIKEKLQAGTTPSKAVEDLLDANLAPDTMNGYGCDNMTCVLVLLGKSSAK